MLNSVKARVKKGKVDRIMNMQIMLIFVVQVYYYIFQENFIKNIMDFT